AMAPEMAKASRRSQAVDTPFASAPTVPSRSALKAQPKRDRARLARSQNTTAAVINTMMNNDGPDFIPGKLGDGTPINPAYPPVTSRQSTSRLGSSMVKATVISTKYHDDNRSA